MAIHSAEDDGAIGVFRLSPSCFADKEKGFQLQWSDMYADRACHMASHPLTMAPDEAIYWFRSSC